MRGRTNVILSLRLASQLHKEGTTVVVVTHEEEIAAFTERIIRFRDGEIVSDKPNVPREPEPCGGEGFGASEEGKQSETRIQTGRRRWGTDYAD